MAMSSLWHSLAFGPISSLLTQMSISVWCPGPPRTSSSADLANVDPDIFYNQGDQVQPKRTNHNRESMPFFSVFIINHLAYVSRRLIRVSIINTCYKSNVSRFRSSPTLPPAPISCRVVDGRLHFLFLLLDQVSLSVVSF